MDMEEKPNKAFDSHETAELLGLSEKQRIFAEALRMGATQTAAAKRAGYSGEDSALRSIASKAAHSVKVRNYLDMAAAVGAGISDEIGDMQDLKRHLWKTVRGADKASGLRATEILARVSALEADKPKPPRDPRAILEEIASISPLLAVQLADEYRVAFKLPDDLNAAADAQRERIARQYLEEHPDRRAVLAHEGSQQSVVTPHNGQAAPVPAQAAGGARHEDDEG